MKIAVRAHEIAGLLDRAPEGIRTLSLDCFDTLLWRNGQAPSDVFTDLGMAGGSIEARVQAEKRARTAQHMEKGIGEVSIEAIYRTLLPGADDGGIAAAVAREIDAEARHCYAFRPVVDLIRAARARGLSVIIVSDTYFSPIQLYELITRVAGDEVVGMIDHVFTSSEHGMSKTEGLFGPVIERLGVAPYSILHLGDNLHADQTAPSTQGIRTAHFEQFDEACGTRLRLEAAAMTMTDPTVRRSVPAAQPHRPLLSLHRESDPARRLGHDVIGPLMHSFVAWIRNEIAVLSAARGQAVKPLFLMRDGHLPMKMFETLESGIEARAAFISRMSANRAGFVDAAAVRQYALREGNRHRFDVLAGLLLLEPNEANKLTGGSRNPHDLVRAVLVPETADKIVRRSARYAERLIAHVRRCGIEDGDAVMLVDLGYNGTVQNLIDPILRRRMNIDAVGRYLLLRETPPSGLDKHGLFDARHYDDDSIKAIGSSIAVIEQICTVAQGSVVDYHPNGKPILEKARDKGAQSEARDRIQAGAIAFGQHARAYGATGAASDDADARRRMAAGILARLMYFPSENEVDVFEAFHHDVNLGSANFLKLLDPAGSIDGLRRRGLPYAQRAQRMFLPAELQSQGLPLSLTLFSIVRFGLDLREGDFHVGEIRVPVIMANARDHALIECSAYPTHDGFYAMTIPARADLTLAIQIGQVCEVVQIDDICFRDPDDLPEDYMGSNPTFPAQSTPDGLDPIADGLYRCGEAGMLVVAPPTQGFCETLALSVTFRPVVRRDVAERMRQAA